MMKETKKLHSLTSLRFFAALMIVLHHSVGLFGIEPFSFNLGQGVSFFFVLSGFILVYAYPELPTFKSVKKFWRSRIARLWPAHFVNFILAFCIIPSSWSSNYALTNLLMIQAWIPSSDYYFSYNAASWSISTELFFYLCFPVLIYSPYAGLID